MWDLKTAQIGVQTWKKSNEKRKNERTIKITLC